MLILNNSSVFFSIDVTLPNANGISSAKQFRNRNINSNISFLKWVYLAIYPLCYLKKKKKGVGGQRIEVMKSRSYKMPDLWLLLQP